MRVADEDKRKELTVRVEVQNWNYQHKENWKSSHVALN